MLIRNIYCWCPWIGRRKHIPSMPYKILIYLLSFLSPHSYNFLFRNPYIAGEKYVPLFTSCLSWQVEQPLNTFTLTSSMGEVTIFYLPYQVQPCCCQTPSKPNQSALAFLPSGKGWNWQCSFLYVHLYPFFSSLVVCQFSC